MGREKSYEATVTEAQHPVSYRTERDLENIFPGKKENVVRIARAMLLRICRTSLCMPVLQFSTISEVPFSLVSRKGHDKSDTKATRSSRSFRPDDRQLFFAVSPSGFSFQCRTRVAATPRNFTLVTASGWARSLYAGNSISPTVKV